MDVGKKLYIAHYMNVISQNVRQLRGPMSQAEFANRVRLSRTSVHRIESRNNFQVTSLLKIAHFFGIFPYDLCLSKDEKKKMNLSLDAMVESIKEAIIKVKIEEIKKD